MTNQPLGSRRAPRNMAASVRSRLTALAHAQGQETEYILTRYALERLLYRITRSSFSDDFILKGALLFALWDERARRPTRDLDLLGFGSDSPERVEHIFRDLCALAVEDDGLVFAPESVRANPIREAQEYGGVRVTLQATLGSARLRVQVDIGFGDVITPSPQEVIFPTLLSLPAPVARAYPRETVVAEKVEALTHLGMTNTRMKDFYDLWLLARLFSFDGLILATAIATTFTRRRTPLPEAEPLALTDVFAHDPGKSAEWRAFILRSRLDSPGLILPSVVEVLRAFLLPPLSAIRLGKAYDDQLWPPGGPWKNQAESG